KIIKGEDEPLNAREVYSHQLIKGFYKVNKSNVLFKKLKNDRLAGRDENFLGVVLDYKKGRALAVHNLHSNRTLKVGDTLKLLNPEGREKSITLTSMKGLS